MLHMDLQDFLRKHIEGYMFGDLMAMSKILSDPETGLGGVCYPMMTVCYTGIELFGGLIYPTDFIIHKERLKTGDSWIYFESYWVNCLSEIDSRYLDLMQFFIDSARNPLTHSFFTNQYISVFKNRTNDHLTEDKPMGRIYLDVNQFSNDLISSYNTYVLPVSKDLSKSVQMQKNLDLIINSIKYKDDTDPKVLLRKFFDKNYHDTTHTSSTSNAIGPSTTTLPNFERQPDTGVAVVPSGTTFNSEPSTMVPQQVSPSASEFDGTTE